MHVRGLVVALIASAAMVMAVAPRPVVAVNVVAHDVKFMDFNYCGVASCGPGGGYSATLANKIQSYRPSVVIIQEICQSQLDALKADLENNTPSPWTFQAYKLDTIDYMSSCAGSNDAFGNAILTQKSLTSCCETWRLTWPDKQSMMCLTTTVGGSGAYAVPLAVCNTHLKVDDAMACDQLEVATPLALDYASGDALLFGGDLNLTPNVGCIDDIYASSGGNFQEMDQVLNRSTHDSGAKIDYMFFKQAYAKDANPEPPDAVGASDHHIFYGTIDICSENVC